MSCPVSGQSHWILENNFSERITFKDEVQLTTKTVLRHGADITVRQTVQCLVFTISSERFLLCKYFIEFKE